MNAVRLGLFLAVVGVGDLVAATIRFDDDFAEEIYRAQKTGSTCWAACNSMLLAAEGIDSSEEDQIWRMSKFLPDGGLNGAGAHFGNARRALAGDYGGVEIEVGVLDRRQGAGPKMNWMFVDILDRGWPCVVATEQHGMVAVGVEFDQFPDGSVVIHAIEVLDPNPMGGGRRWLHPVELANVFGFMFIKH